MNLSTNIYNHRTALNWSQTDLADNLGVSRQSVSKWENGSSTPDLDKLIKMKELFGVSLDDLVFGKQSTATPKEGVRDFTKSIMPPSLMNLRTVCGILMLIFGMVFFLLSMFFGNYLYFGEAFGEFFSLVIVLISISLIFPFDFRVLSICSIIYFIYCVIMFGFLNISSISSYLFTFIASAVLIVWFIVCGEQRNRGLVQNFENQVSIDGEKTKNSETV